MNRHLRYGVVIVLIAALFLTGCAAEAKSAASEGGDSLRSSSTAPLEVQRLAEIPLFKVSLMLVGSAAFVIALARTYTKPRDWYKWTLIMACAFLWFFLGDLVNQMIITSWPSSFTSSYIDQALGRGGGVIPSGDVSPWSGAFVGATITAVTTILWVTHVIVVIWFLILPLLILIENLMGGQRSITMSIGAWSGVLLTRVLAPHLLLIVVNLLMGESATPSGTPVVGALQATAQNTLNQLNGKFVVGWWGVMAFMSALPLIVAFSSSAVTTGLGGAAGKYGLEFVELLGIRQALKEAEDSKGSNGDSNGKTGNNNVMSSEAYDRTVGFSNDSRKGRRDDTKRELYTCKDCGFSSSKSGSCPECGGRVSRSSQPTNNEGSSREPGRRTGSGSAVKGEAAKLSAAVGTAGVVLTAVGQPEGLILAAAGDAGIRWSRGQSDSGTNLPTEHGSQDPMVSAERSRARGIIDEGL